MRVLVVCSGNICRSPLAAAAMRRHVEGHDIEVTSAGTIAETGRPATPTMQSVAAEHGLDLEDHRSAPLDGVEPPDLIFGMDAGHLVAARRAFPDIGATRIRLLDHPHDVPDPYGRGIDAYRESARQILSAIERLDPATFAID